MKFPIALQLYSVRDRMEKDFEGTLRAVKEMGYDGVEFAGLFGKSAAEIKAICDGLGLTPLSAHIPYVDMAADPSLLDTYAEIGCEFAVYPYLTEEYRPGNEKFDEFLATARVLSDKANRLGMKMAYHNHDFEFKKIDGKYALDILYSELSAEQLQTEIDTCWVNVGGENPADYIRKYAGRCEVVHLKDFVGEKSENMYALIGIKSDESAQSKAFAFRHLGSGVQNFAEILTACEESGTRWVVVEQDNPTEGLTSLECAQKSIDYLKSL